MTLPNPGDFARVINDPDMEGGKSNLGKVVHVVSFLDPKESLLAYISFNKYGQAMVCTALEPFWVPETPVGPRSLNPPGITVGIVRTGLRRIEPDQAEHLWLTYETSHDTLTNKAVKEKQSA